MWSKRLVSPACCGGPVLAMALLCLGFGILFLLLSALALGFVFAFVGLLSEGLCLYLSRRRCPKRAAKTVSVS